MRARKSRALGKLGGRKGGKARAEKLNPEQRSAIAKKAAQARRAKRRQSKKWGLRSGVLGAK